MKNPLHYQLSEYDCGPTTMLNAVSYLFEREDIPPELIRNIMLYSLDCYNEEGIAGKNGTSCAAMKFLCNWLNGFGKTGQLPISCEYLSGEAVYVGNDSPVNAALRHGGVAVVRLFFFVEHYVLLTGDTNGNILVFDPYLLDEPLDEKDILLIEDHPYEYNRMVPYNYFNQLSDAVYSLGAYAGREAVLLFNNNAHASAEKAV